MMDGCRQHLLRIFMKAHSQIFCCSPETHSSCDFAIQYMKKSDREKPANESTCLFS